MGVINVRWLDAKLSYLTGPSQRTTMNWIERGTIVVTQESGIGTSRP
jgi:hypothetical protein